MRINKSRYAQNQLWVEKTKKYGNNNDDDEKD